MSVTAESGLFLLSNSGEYTTEHLSGRPMALLNIRQGFCLCSARKNNLAYFRRVTLKQRIEVLKYLDMMSMFNLFSLSQTT